MPGFSQEIRGRAAGLPDPDPYPDVRYKSPSAGLTSDAVRGDQQVLEAAALVGVEEGRLDATFSNEGS